MSMPSRGALAEMLYEQYAKYKGGVEWSELEQLQKLAWIVIAETFTNRLFQELITPIKQDKSNEEDKPSEN